MSPMSWISSLGRASLEGAVLILVVWAICRPWRGIPAWARSGLWWLASARLLVALAPLAPVAVPAPPLSVAWPAAITSSVVPAAAPAASIASPTAEAGGTPARPAAAIGRAPGSGSRLPRIPLGSLLLALWAAGFAFRLGGMLRQLARVRRVRAEAEADSEPATFAAPLGARVALHPEVSVPMVTGLWNPIVLLPARMAEGPASERALAVAHELSHVRRGDLWLAWIPALAEAVFWFHPLARVCVREYVQACEEACDEDTLRATGAHPYDYGRLLLSLGIHRRWSAAGAIGFGSSHPRQLKRRLSMLERLAPRKPRVRALAGGVLCAFGLMALAPLRLVATVDDRPAPDVPVATASVAVEGPVAHDLAPPDEPEIAPPPDEYGADEPQPEDQDPSWWDDSSIPPIPPVPPTPATAPTPPTPVTPPTRYVPRDWWASRAPAAVRARRAAEASRARSKRSVGYTYSYDSADDPTNRFAYVLVLGDRTSMTGSGSTLDWKEVRRLRERIDGDFLWVRNGGRRYLIRDPEILAQIEDAFAPQTEIGARQSRLGAAQSRIGAQQSRIGGEQSRIGEQQSEIGRRQAELAESMAYRHERRRASRDLEDAMAELSAEMEELGRAQERLATRMEPLSRQQEELGDQMEVLGREMERASRVASRKVRSLIEEAIHSGQAEPLR